MTFPLITDLKILEKEGLLMENLNKNIKGPVFTVSAEYLGADRVNKPQQISKKFSAKKKTIGDNGHENWTLLRLCPFMVGHLVPDKEKAWETLIILKDIVCSFKLSDETFCYLETKITSSC